MFPLAVFVGWVSATVGYAAGEWWTLRKATRRQTQEPWYKGMTRDQIVDHLRRQNSDYHVDVVFNDDDTIRSISGYRMDGHYRPWRASGGES